MIRRMWFIASVDVKEDINTRERVPIHEPIVLASTIDSTIAEKALGVLVSAEKVNSVETCVRSTVETLPIEIQEVMENKPKTLLDEMLDGYEKDPT